MQLENKRVLLTGASGGIGQAIATDLDKHSARLLLVGRNEEKLQQLQQSLNGDHQLVIADLNTVDGRAAVVSACQEEGLDVYISAVGVMDFQFYEKQDSDCIEKMMATNLVSPILLCHQLLPLLLKQPQAAIINIGSIFGSIGHPGFTAYCASKFGLRGFTEALQRELADTNVKVAYLAPRATRTDLNSSAVTALNEALGNATDDPQQVAKELMGILAGKRKQRFMGWPENLFVRVNSLFPGVVHNALVKKLPIIRHHAGQ
jgi:short-subunit dehydrogenase